MKTILRVLAGSHLLGLNTPTSDYDEDSIVIESPIQALGFSRFEQKTSTKPDIAIYGLRRYLMLAMNGNPNTLQPLFASGEAVREITDTGIALQKLAPYIVSKRAGKAFLGYLHEQRLRMTGEKGNGGHGAMRPELIAKYGFDTKYAMHMLRLGIQGVEFMKTGTLQLPMAEEHRKFLLGVRHGEFPAKDCIEKAKELENEIRDLFTTSTLPVYSNDKKVEEWLVSTYLKEWNNKSIT